MTIFIICFILVFLFVRIGDQDCDDFVGSVFISAFFAFVIATGVVIYDDLKDRDSTVQTSLGCKTFGFTAHSEIERYSKGTGKYINRSFVLSSNEYDIHSVTFSTDDVVPKIVESTIAIPIVKEHVVRSGVIRYHVDKNSQECVH